MSEQRHTPGPWKAIQGVGPLDDPDTDETRWCVVAAGNDHEYLIATVENGQPGDCLETEGHTAHLIAAAPDLLEYARLEEAVEEFDCPHDADARCNCGPRQDAMYRRARSLRKAALAKAEGHQP